MHSTCSVAAQETAGQVVTWPAVVSNLLPAAANRIDYFTPASISALLGNKDSPKSYLYSLFPHGSRIGQKAENGSQQAQPTAS